MMKAHKKTMIIASILTVLPMLAGLYLWDRLPDQMATHFDAGSEANSFTSKPFAVIGLPLILLAALWVSAFVMANDPKRKNISPKMFSLPLWLVPVISWVGAAAIYMYNLDLRPDMMFFSKLVMGIIFIVVGNLLPKARQNYTIGIKIPWTLANEENWNRTHRLAGYLWVAGGILMVILAFIKGASPKWTIAVFMVMAVIPYAYSYWLYSKQGL